MFWLAYGKTSLISGVSEVEELWGKQDSFPNGLNSEFLDTDFLYQRHK